MSHSIQVIVAPDRYRDAILCAWAELPCFRHSDGFSIFPVDCDLIDAKIAPIETPRESGDKFMLLTPAFEDYLRQLSVGRLLAYIETDYFGGAGGQGALVFADGVDRMSPEWNRSGTINRALKRIGVLRPLLGDRFTRLGLADVRNNDDLVRLADEQGAASNTNT